MSLILRLIGKVTLDMQRCTYAFYISLYYILIIKDGQRQVSEGDKFLQHFLSFVLKVLKEPLKEMESSYDDQYHFFCLVDEQQFE